MEITFEFFLLEIEFLHYMLNDACLRQFVALRVTVLGARAGFAKEAPSYRRPSRHLRLALKTNSLLCG